MSLIQQKSKKRNVCVLTPNATCSTTLDNITLVLSPHYYWVKAERLPVKSIHQAKKMAASLFDGAIALGEYDYHVIKNDDIFWVFAYDSVEIAEQIAASGLRPNQISEVYFAQSECVGIQSPLLIDSEHVLVDNEGVISMLPKQYANTWMNAQDYFDSHQFSKHRIGINLHQSTLLNDKTIQRLTIVSLVFVLIFFIDYIRLNQHVQALQLKKFAVIEQFNLPETSFELKGLKRSLEATEARQMAFRNTFKKLLSLPQGTGFLQKVTLKKGQATLEYHLEKAEDAEGIKKMLESDFKIVNPKVVDNTFYVGVRYEQN